MGICCNEMTKYYIYTSRVYFIRWKKRPYPDGGGHQNLQERQCRLTLVCWALDISHKILSAVRITWYNCPRTGRVETHVVWTHILRFWNAQDGRALQILLSFLKTRVYKYCPLLSSVTSIGAHAHDRVTDLTFIQCFNSHHWCRPQR